MATQEKRFTTTFNGTRIEVTLRTPTKRALAAYRRQRPWREVLSWFLIRSKGTYTSGVRWGRRKDPLGGKARAIRKRGQRFSGSPWQAGDQTKLRGLP
jgi:hypothetical protein